MQIEWSFKIVLNNYLRYNVLFRRNILVQRMQFLTLEKITNGCADFIPKIPQILIGFDFPGKMGKIHLVFFFVLVC